MSDTAKLLGMCGGVEVRQVKQTWHRGTTYKYFKIGEVTLPDMPLYIAITATATKGTIGRLVGIEVQTLEDRYRTARLGGSNPNEISVYDTTFIYEVDGRSQKGRIKAAYTTLLESEQTTKYVRNVNNNPKKEIKNPVNKFKQELNKGDWVFGISSGKRKRIIIGRVTRWTNHNVWCSTGALDDKNKEIQLDSIQETFLAPNDDHLSEITLAVLKGWNGW